MSASGGRHDRAVLDNLVPGAYACMVVVPSGTRIDTSSAEARGEATGLPPYLSTVSQEAHHRGGDDRLLDRRFPAGAQGTTGHKGELRSERLASAADIAYRGLPLAPNG
jgi:hypothetical protein